MKETQYFRQWWMLVIIAVMLGISIWGFIVQIVLQQPFGNVPMSDSGLIVLTALMLSLMGVLLSMRLESRADEHALCFRFYPVQFKKVCYRWEDMESIELKRYNPLIDYGGWGWRISVTGKGRAFNVSGNLGLYIVLKNGKKRLLGVKDSTGWDNYLKELSTIKQFNYNNSLPQNA
jgi:hypothetical protein